MWCVRCGSIVGRQGCARSPGRNGPVRIASRGACRRRHCGLRLVVAGSRGRGQEAIKKVGCCEDLWADFWLVRVDRRVGQNATALGCGQWPSRHCLQAPGGAGRRPCEGRRRRDGAGDRGAAGAVRERGQARRHGSFHVRGLGHIARRLGQDEEPQKVSEVRPPRRSGHSSGQRRAEQSALSDDVGGQGYAQQRLGRLLDGARWGQASARD
mmetsp:Transcript_12850/g.32118  ORF Transcript_12850/g.32118 Transcript_12850/m.32118 type:complete len:211 (+) Transcript_12850:501-1133(+)